MDEAYELMKKRTNRVYLNEKITVCDKCLRACCWHGIFMCDEAFEPNTGTTEKTRKELIKLDREHTDYMTNE